MEGVVAVKVTAEARSKGSRCLSRGELSHIADRSAWSIWPNGVNAPQTAPGHQVISSSLPALPPACCASLTRPHQSLVQHIRPVGTRQHNHVCSGGEAVHLHQQLVEGVLSLIVAARKAGAAAGATNGVDFV